MRLPVPKQRKRYTLSDRVFDEMLAGIIHNHTGMNIGRKVSKAKKAARKRVRAARRANW